MMDKPKQVATMVLKVDLQCWRCYKKVKNLLCKFPQVQDQVYDEKQNTVTVKVVCCCPEKIMRKIICKGGDSIKSFDVKVSDKKPSPDKETPKPTKPDKQPSGNGKSDASPGEPKQAGPDKKKPNGPVSTKGDQPEKSPTPPVPVNQPPEGPIRTCCPECYAGRDGGPCVYGYGGRPPCYQDGSLGRPVPVDQPPKDPIRTCCRECSEGRGGGPCVYGYGWQQPCYQYGGYLGRPVYDSYGGGRGSCYLICEEDSRQLCRIM